MKTVSDLPDNSETPAGPLAEVGRFLRLSDARERGLVIAAMERPHWIDRQGRAYVLSVEAPDRDAALAALAEFERDERARVAPVPLEPLRIPVFAVVMTLLVMILLFTVQQTLPAATVDAGISDDALILRGQWWRAFTALTLHGDAGHLAMNLSLAAVVFAFAFWRFRTGVGLTAVIVAGALGNVFNALAHFQHPHRSLGSSTALFAAIGLITGAELAARLARRGTRIGWSFFVPLGAGLTFLAFYGSVDDPARAIAAARDTGIQTPGPQTDIFAHLFGLAAGMLVGLLWCLSGLGRKMSPRAQSVALFVGPALLVLAWLLALR